MSAQVKVVGCDDPSMWYYKYVGVSFAYLEEDEDYYMVRDAYGYRNIILQEDGEFSGQVRLH